MIKTLMSIGTKTAEKKVAYFEIVGNHHNPANQMFYQEFIQMILAQCSEKFKKAS